MPIWDQFLTDRDKRVFVDSGYGRRAGFGQRPVVLVVDVNYNFVGDRPEPIEESVKRWRNSCGAEGWQAAEHIRTLVDTAREQGVPVIYSTGAPSRPDGFDRGRWSDKNSRNAEDLTVHQADGNTIIAPIAPMPQDIVIEKGKPSVFFGTLLSSYLVDLQADSIIACGTTTSGCVRATVIDGFSLNFRMSVVEECTFDRGEASHAINLFDMHQKYADVVLLAETLEFLRQLPRGLFDARMPILRERAPALAGARG
jgi:nicotinamidase-related amidase